MMPELNYHQAALDLLDLKPEFSAKSVDRLDFLEKERDLILPPAMKEWYSLKNAYRTLKKYSNDDNPVKLECMVKDFEQIYDENYMTIMVENQGVWRWALKLQRAHDLVSEAQAPLPLFEFEELHNQRLDSQVPVDDPPVYIRLNQPFAHWELHAQRFSDFIYYRIWDAQTAPYAVSARMSRTLSEDDLSLLRSHLTERLTTYFYPRGQTYRFERDDARVMIWSDAQASYWSVFAQTSAGFSTLLDMLRAVPDLNKTFYAVSKRSVKILKASQVT